MTNQQVLDHTVDADVVKANVRSALAEDLGMELGASDGTGQLTTRDVSAALISAEVISEARVITRDAGIFCGEPWIRETLKQVNPSIDLTMAVADADTLEAGQLLFSMRGPATSLLTAERTMLNFVQLLSGTATKTAHFCSLVAQHPVQLLDTRKTIPGLRVAQKYAVTCGGGANHRMGLFDAYLLKENHIAACGGIPGAVAAARKAHPELPVEVEVETLEELQQAIDAGANIAMVDNFSLADTRIAVEMAAGKLKLEASGGIDETSITDIAATGVDYISIGELTKNVDPLDLSMRFVES